MERKSEQYIPIRGMNKDTSISKFSKEFLYDAMNIRVNNLNKDSLLTITNEKGNKQLTINSERFTLKGTAIGYCVLNEYLVIFTTTRETTDILTGTQTASTGIDRIYRLNKADGFGEGHYNVEFITLYEGESNGTVDNSLNFSKDSFIETLGLFESDEVQKVYFIDKNNQFRFINIVSEHIGEFTKDSFDANPELLLKEKVSVEKRFTGGVFSSGVIQYACTYWNKNGTETNIVWVSGLELISGPTSVGAPDENVSCNFKITINTPQTGFDYLRIYAIHRTSLDAIPTARIVKDINLLNETAPYNLIVVDTGQSGSNVDPNSLLFIGGEELIIGTMTTKDSVLFGGNIKLKRPSLESITGTLGSLSWKNTNAVLIQQMKDQEPVSDEYSDKGNSVYNYRPYTLLPNEPYKKSIRHWKQGETYRIGIQAQYKTGIWSEVKHIVDSKVNLPYKTSLISDPSGFNTIQLRYVDGDLTINAATSKALLDLGYKNIRAVYVPLNSKTRSVIGQGILTNTIANVGNRKYNAPYAYPDYYARGNNEFINQTGINYHTNDASIGLETLLSCRPVWQMFSPLNTHVQTSYGLYSYEEMEVKNPNNQNTCRNDIDTLLNNPSNPNDRDYTKYLSIYFIDSNLVNFWSPDLEFGDLSTIANEATHVQLRGAANISASDNSVDLILEKTGVKLGWQSKAINYFSSANRVLAKGSVWGDSFTGITYLPVRIWNSQKLNSSNNFTVKHYNRFVYCGFNDMLDSLPINTKFAINAPTNVDVDDIAVNHNGHKYLNHVDEILSKSDDAEVITTRISYKVNKHLLFQFKDRISMPIWKAAEIGLSIDTLTDIGNRNRDKFFTPYYEQFGLGNYTVPKIDNEVLLNIEDSYMRTRNFNQGYAYFWIVDLIRDIEDQYGDINFNTWIPASNITPISGSGTTIKVDRGDTFIQRYDLLKTVKGEENFQDMVEVVSVLIESFENIDARYDTKRFTINNIGYTLDNYIHLNDVYKQKDNFFEYNVLDYDLLSSDNLPTTFLWSESKIYNELIDSWTSLYLNKSYTVEGNHGSINWLDIFNNEIFGFQDKGIFNIIFNPRVQVPVSTGQPIEITNSGEMQGIRYINNKVGLTNKWATVKSDKQLYFIDSINKDLYTLGTPCVNVSEALGFKQWFHNNVLGTEEYSSANTQSFILSIDDANNDIYINNKDYSLGLSERLNAFESFYSYKYTPFMFNIWNQHIALWNNGETPSLWAQRVGDYNNFFDHPLETYLTYYMNPDSVLDKVFDSINYRMDVFTKDGEYLPRETFNTIEVNNEHQQGIKTLMVSPNKPNINTKKKFRSWGVTLPRQLNSMNRIRNPWIKMKLTFKNDSRYMRMDLHDLILNYTV